MGALARFLLVLGNLVKNGTIKKIDQAIKFAKNETVNELRKENFIYSFLSSVRQKMLTKTK